MVPVHFSTYVYIVAISAPIVATSGSTFNWIDEDVYRLQSSDFQRPNVYAAIIKSRLRHQTPCKVVLSLFFEGRMREGHKTSIKECYTYPRSGAIRQRWEAKSHHSRRANLVKKAKERIPKETVSKRTMHSLLRLQVITKYIGRLDLSTNSIRTCFGHHMSGLVKLFLEGI